MSSYDDQDHYDIQFSTRQLALLFGLLVVIVGGVFVGGIVIGRNMSHEAREVIAARRSGGPIVPPATSGDDAAPATRASEAPSEPPATPPASPEPERTASRQPVPERAAPRPTPETRVADAAPAPPPTETVPTPPAAAAPDGQFTIQVAAFRDRDAAETLLARIGEMGLEGYLEGTPAGIFRVRVGRFATREDARQVAARLEAEELAALVTSR